MGTVDELLVDPSGALELPAGAVPLHAILLVEYVVPGAELIPERPRLSIVTDDELSGWQSIGMLQFALQRELNAIDGEGYAEPDD